MQELEEIAQIKLQVHKDLPPERKNITLSIS